MQLDGFQQYGQPPAAIVFGNHGPSPKSARPVHTDPQAPVHQSAFDADDIQEAVAAAGCNPHAVGQVLAASHEGTVVELQRSGPNCS